MIKHIIYGFFGLLAAIVIAVAIYIDKPVPEVAQEHTRTEESEIVDTQIAGATAASAGAGEQELLELIKVIDGDTIAIQKGGSSETVRMIGLNAPETGTCYTGEATQKLKNLLASGKVSLELDASQGERDKYDRLLAYVFSESGVNTAKALIEGGFAKEYTYSKAYKYQTEFKTAQTSAQTAQKGLWAPGVCAKPAAAPAQTVV
ncbi:MAG: thermonuclease family protein, partial [Patescibacteria group bacterium]|nr:thermonuclease family protein [Patescibacteria group bacterium]